jgi:hypothetical protein
MKRRLTTLNKKIEKLVDLIAEEVDATPAYRRSIAKMEADHAALSEEIQTTAAETHTAECVALWTPADVQKLLGGLLVELKESVKNKQTQIVRAALSELIEVIKYDTGTRQAVIRYRPDTGVKMASPREFARFAIPYATEYTAIY